MNGPQSRGPWPRRRGAALAWLARESVRERFIDHVFARTCALLGEDGVPVARATLHLHTLHPQLAGATLRWRHGRRDAEIVFHERGVFETDEYRHSPIRPLVEGDAERIRFRLDRETVDFAVLRALAEEGFTDYVGFALTFTDGRRHAATFATRATDGFTDAQLADLADILPLLAMAVEIRLQRRIARNLLATYVGARAGERILAGEIARGAGETIEAALWIFDLRGFTALAQRLPLEELLALANAAFDAVGEAIARHRGEILKFMGDGLLAVWSFADSPDACGWAFDAAVAALAAFDRTMDARRARGLPVADAVVAVHAGRVLWGNIGTRSRLDFTVFGSDVAIAERLEELAKRLGTRILLSDRFVRGCRRAGALARPLGAYRLRGVEVPVAVSTLDPAALARASRQQ